jgi:DNA-binding response OmpR family regulator
MTQKVKVLIIDDDARLVEALIHYLRKANYEVVTAQDGVIGLQQLYQHRPDLVILDVMMPKLDGWETCRRIRELSNVPIVMLTARGQESDTVMGLHLGADDYVTKPFSLRELEARIEAVMRRGRRSDGTEGPALYADRRLFVDPTHWLVVLNGEPLNLTATERRLLFLLVENAGRVLTPIQILENVWGPEYVSEVDYVKLYIYRLRQKIEEDPGNPRYLVTERGIGYRFVRADS